MLAICTRMPAVGFALHPHKEIERTATPYDQVTTLRSMTAVSEVTVAPTSGSRLVET